MQQRKLNQLVGTRGGAVSAREFFLDLESLFSAAKENSTSFISRVYRLGENRLCINFANKEAFFKLSPAIEHLELREAQADPGIIEINVWDSISTSTSVPQCPWDLSLVRADCSVEDFDTESIFCRVQLGLNSIHMFNSASSTCLYWIENLNNIPWWECVSPFRILLNKIAESQNKLIVHAASLGFKGEGAALLIGQGGSGKSTTALTGTSYGLLHGGDDSVLVDFQSNDVYVHTLYSTAKLTLNSLERLGEFRKHIHSYVGEAADKKALFYLNQCLPNSILSSAKLKFVALPKVSFTSKTTFEKISKQKALLSMAPNSLFPIPGSGPAKFKMMARLVNILPCYQLNLGLDPKEVSESIKGFLINDFNALK